METHPFASEDDVLGVAPHMAADTSEEPLVPWWGSNVALIPSGVILFEWYKLVVE